MRYWQHYETGKLLKIDLQMAPSRWVELTEEQYNEMETLQREDLERINNMVSSE